MKNELGVAKNKQIGKTAETEFQHKVFPKFFQGVLARNLDSHDKGRISQPTTSDFTWYSPTGVKFIEVKTCDNLNSFSWKTALRPSQIQCATLCYSTFKGEEADFPYRILIKKTSPPVLWYDVPASFFLADPRAKKWSELEKFSFCYGK